VTSSFAVFEAQLGYVKNQDITYYHVRKPEKKRKYGNERIFLHKSSSRGSFRHRMHTNCYNEMMPEEALTSFTVS